MRIILLSTLVAVFLRQDGANRQVRELVQKLRSEKIEEREDATRRLKEVGKGAIAELERVAADRDLEVATRARRLIKLISVSERLTPNLMKAIPGVEERLAEAPMEEWTKVFLEAAGGRPGSIIRRCDLECLVPEAIEGTKSLSTIQFVSLVIGLCRLKVPPDYFTTLIKATNVVMDPSWVGKQLAPAATSPEAVRALGGLLEERDWKLRYTAIEMLATIGTPGVSSRIIPLLDDKVETVRSAAARAVGQLGDERAIPSLIRMLKDPDAHVRDGAARGLGRMGAAEAAKELLSLLGDREANVRAGAAWAVGRLRLKEGIPRLRELLADGESLVRGTAALQLGSLRVVDALPDLAKLLEDDHDGIRENDAPRALAFFDPKDVAPHILRLLKDGSTKVRTGAVETAGNLRAKDCVPDLVRLLNDKELSVRRSAAESLGQLGVTEALPELIRLLKQGDISERLSAAKAVCGIPDKSAVPALLEAMKCPAPSVRIAAALALAECGSKEGVSDLVKFLSFELGVLPGADDGGHIIQVLRKLAPREVVPELVSFLVKGTPKPQILLGALRELAPKEAVKAAKDRTSDRDWLVRTFAAELLCELGQDEAMEVVLAESKQLMALNALRNPIAWRRLEKVKVARDPRGSRREILKELEDLTGGQIDWPAAPDRRGALWFHEPVWFGWSGAWYRKTALHVLCDLLSGSPYEAILEDNRIRLLSREKALGFWRAWRTERRNDK